MQSNVTPHWYIDPKLITKTSFRILTVLLKDVIYVSGLTQSNFSSDPGSYAARCPSPNHRRSQRVGAGPPPPPIEILPMIKMS